MLYDIDGNNSTEVNYSSSGGTWEGNSFGSSGAAYSFVDPNGGNDVVYALSLIHISEPTRPY